MRVPAVDTFCCVFWHVVLRALCYVIASCFAGTGSGDARISAIMEELRREDIAAFKNFLRVNTLIFQELVARLTPITKKKNSWFQRRCYLV